MAGSVNKVILVGNLGADPEIRRMASGDAVANMRIATTESWRDRNTGERRDRTEWHNVVIFNDALVKVVEQYVKKGSKLYIEGQLQTRKWQDQNGNDRYTTEIVLQKFRGELHMLDSRGGGGDNRSHLDNQSGYGSNNYQSNNQSGGYGGGYSGNNNQSGGYGDNAKPAGDYSRDLNDEVPF